MRVMSVDLGVQGERYDPGAASIARWVPELARLPVKYRHRPWETPPEVLTAAGVELVDRAALLKHGKAAGETMMVAGLYPLPIVDPASQISVGKGKKK
jgi:deoxyribodipyrimidine photolyase